MVIYFATDHAGFALKHELVTYVREELGHEVVDCGAHTLDEHDDYPDFINTAASAVAKSPLLRRAIILGGSGQGEAMAANKYPAIRAAVYYGGDPRIITLSREHNDANVLSLGARFMTTDDAKKAVRMWLETPFSGEERHVRRIRKMYNGRA